VSSLPPASPDILTLLLTELFTAHPVVAVQVLDVKESGYETSHKLELCGHRSDIRCLALASDDSQLLSGSNSGCKLWDPVSGGGPVQLTAAAAAGAVPVTLVCHGASVCDPDVIKMPDVLDLLCDTDTAMATATRS
jgi:WD40 repeat protein